MKTLTNNDRFSWYVLLFYGVIINMIWFFSAVYLEKVFFERDYIWTSLVYLILMSLMITKFYDNSFMTRFFIKSLLYLIFALATTIVLYFLSWNLSSSLLTYCVVSISYLSFMAIILSKIPFIKLNITFFIHQLVVFSVTLFSCYFLLSSSQYYDYGVPFLFSFWLLCISIYMVVMHQRRTAINGSVL